MKLKNVLFAVLFICLASMFNAGMDSISFHYNTSFAKALDLNENFWNPSQSWRNKYVDLDPAKGRKKINLLSFQFELPVIFTDGWHLLKASMIFSFFLSLLVWIPGSPLKKLLSFIVLAVIWNVVFNLIYSINFL
jgi:hypothetical protein